MNKTREVINVELRLAVLVAAGRLTEEQYTRRLAIVRARRAREG